MAVIQTPTDQQPPPCAVAIGASAGGVQALRTIISALPADLRAAVFVVLHLDPKGRSLLPMLLAAVTPLPVQSAHEGALVESGTIYVAIPDHHLLVSDGRIRLAVSEPVCHARPSVDRLFGSIALGWRTAVVGVVLTGSGVDGASGIAAIKHGGGRTIAQDPRDAEFPGMPRAAIATGFVDSVLPLVAIGPEIARAVAAAAATRAA